MRIILFYDTEDDEVWYYIGDGKDPLPFYIAPRKEKEEKEEDENDKVH